MRSDPRATPISACLAEKSCRRTLFLGPVPLDPRMRPRPLAFLIRPPRHGARARDVVREPRGVEARRQHLRLLEVA